MRTDNIIVPIPVGNEPCCAACGNTIPTGTTALRRDKTFNPEARETIKTSIEAASADLKEISLFLHANPELKWEEFKAHEKITTFLTKEGFKVESIEGMPTAFRAAFTQGTGGRTFGLNSEYDALAEIGHGCGHNLIAISGIAALLGLRAAMQKHNIPGTVVLLGTPAEEGGVGKQLLLDKGAYSDMDACMMLHPGPGPSPKGHIGPSLASIGVQIEYFGKAAHAAMAPWAGVSALEAAILAHNSIAALRQQMRPEVRVHGVITQGGGYASNIIPAYAELTYSVRGISTAALEETWVGVKKCFENAALTTGCTVKINRGLVHDDLRNSKPMCEEYAATMEEMFGIPVTYGFDQAASWGASTDFGNVSYVLPGCHPMIGMPTPPGCVNHTVDFTTIVGQDEAHVQTFKASTAMACVGLRFLADTAYAKQVAQYFKEDMGK
ncbi:hypothetical protein BCR39DRAFT_319392 [Naematelia encephala]|uniref:Peptidase M20 domain-containing protein 2 n=1 Tax=Naematelia encephala TaxID=71784 RepID=A0A1Y2AQ07_9TREE|nr:hypothetical protein BCR39DRAFT_319392 [Naematelia encephala]